MNSPAADHLGAIVAETERFISAIEATSPDDPVPTCPDWTAANLLAHFTEVHAFWTRVLKSGALTDEEVEAVDRSKPAVPEDRGQAIQLLRDETAALVAEIERQPDAAPAWSWFGADQSVGFTRRMQAYEAAMHRIDAELTAGMEPTRLDPALGAGAVDHAFDVMFAWWSLQPGFSFSPAPGSVTLSSTDTGDTWTVRSGRWKGVGQQSGKSYDEPGVQRTGDRGDASGGTGAAESGNGATADVTVSASAEALARWLWGRGPEPVVHGGGPALDGLRAVIAGGMQ